MSLRRCVPRVSSNDQELERLGVDIAPTRIDGEVSDHSPSSTTGVSRSVWNQAGTWQYLPESVICREEMDLSKWAMKRIPEILKEGKFDRKGVWFWDRAESQYSIRIEDVEKCEGQATYVFVKVLSRCFLERQGKKRPGFDISLKLKWCAVSSDDPEEAEGTIVINDVCSIGAIELQFSDTAGGDYEWAFKSNSSDANHVKAKAAVQACKKDIQDLLDKWISEFKNFQV